jgi:hypothetical protein
MGVSPLFGRNQKTARRAAVTHTRKAVTPDGQHPTHAQAKRKARR